MNTVKRMLEPEAPFVTMIPRPRHVLAASIAAFLSLVVHLLFLVGMRHLDIDLQGLLSYLPLSETSRRVFSGSVLSDTSPIPVEDGAAADSQVLALELSDVVEELGVSVAGAVLDPPPRVGGGPTAELPRMAEPTLPEVAQDWQPRQAILAVEHRIADDSAALLARVPVPLVERVIDAPDVVLPADLTKVTTGGDPRVAAAREVLEQVPETVPIALPQPATQPAIPEPAPVPSERVVSSSADLFVESPEEVTEIQPIERVLKASVVTYTSRRDRDHGFFRIAIARLGSEVLPVMPKDVLFLQDCSNSMSEKRLFFCREGLLKCLDELGPEDRFDIVSFRQQMTRCFGTWTQNTPVNREKGRAFVRAMSSGGNTDIFASLQQLVALNRKVGRPIVVMLVSDGLATAGKTGSSEIIREFTAMNDGMMSVFCVGTVQTANRYLLDLLSYSNRGGTFLVPRGRWEIPEAMVGIMRETKRPVLTDVSFRVPAGSRCEVYPRQTSNLYLDQPLMLYGRFPEGEERLAFQAVGRNGAQQYDMLFDVSLEGRAARDDGSMAREWARHRIYHDITRYTRTRDPDVLRTIRDTARKYDVDVPHRGRY